MVWRNLQLLAMIISVAVIATCATAQAQAGRPPTAEEIHAWDSAISPEGKGLPAGSGTADAGGKIFAQKCAACHGQNGFGGDAPALAISKDSTVAHPHTPFPVQIAFAPILWDYIHRAMPMLIGPGSLKPDDVYSLTAFLLYENDVIKQTDVLDAQTLPKIKMPARDTYMPPMNARKKP